MRKICLYVLLFLAWNETSGQFRSFIDSMCEECNRPGTPAEKITRLGKLANIYFIFKNDSLACVALNKQLEIANLSSDPSLMKLVLSGDAIKNFSSTASRADFDHVVDFVKKGIEYVEDEGDNDLLALGYVRLSEVLLKRGDLDEALSAGVQAIVRLPNVTKDSIRSVAFVNLGNVYMERGESVTASSNFNNAFDIALKTNDTAQQCLVYHRVAEMYFRLGHPDEAIAEIKKSLLLHQNPKSPNGEGITADFYDLARYSEQKYFISAAINYADSLHLLKYLLDAKRLMLAWYEVIARDSKAALSYLASEQDLRQSYVNSGMDNYYMVVGNIFYYGGKGDSAVYYFEKAKPLVFRKHDKAGWRVLYEQLGAGYALSGQHNEAINYYLKSLALARELKNKSAIAANSLSLGNLYKVMGNYQDALKNTEVFLSYSDTLKEMSKERDLALLGVERENKKHDQELVMQRQKENMRKNLQYTIISIAIVIAFFLMLFLGSFSVSKPTLRFMGYLFFISLFEFITLIIDNVFVSASVHNQPLWSWIIKIGLVLLLVPFQHFLEHNITALLESRKLIEARSRFSVKALWAKIKRPETPKSNTDEEAAIL